MLLEVLGTGFSGSYKTKRVCYFFAMRSADQLFSCSVTKSNDSSWGLERIVVECTNVDANTNDTHVTIHVRCFGLDWITLQQSPGKFKVDLSMPRWLMYVCIVCLCGSVLVCAMYIMCTVHGRGMTPCRLIVFPHVNWPHPEAWATPLRACHMLLCFI